jgi:SAM-dependent methyltransferase
MCARPAGRGFLTHAPEAVHRIAWSFPEAADDAIERANLALGEVAWHDDVQVAAWAVAEPFHALIALALLADDPASIAGARMREVYPELGGLAVPREVTTYEHRQSMAGERRTPLLDRVIHALALAVPEAEKLDAEQRSLLTAALLFSDVAKGGTPEQRETWRARLGVDGTVHNEDSAVIFEDIVRRVLGKVALSDDGRWAERVRVLCATSGLVGMRLRGEVGHDALAPFIELATTEPDGGSRLGVVWSIVNRCEARAVVREGWTPELGYAFQIEERGLMLGPASSRKGATRAMLTERIARMRGGALMKRESLVDVEASLDRLRAARHVLESRLSRCRVWYAEPVLGALSLDSAIRLLLFLSGAAHKAGVDLTGPWHLDLLAIVSQVRNAEGEPRRYHVRLLETLLEATQLEDLRAGQLAGGTLVSFPSTKGGEQALAVRFETSPEASALLSLLGIYEKKASAAFHHTLKSLCDLYDLRKDEYDRVHNESAYLATMNAARSDKTRMLEYVKPGVIVEVGPGGGVVLELLAERYPTSRIVGIDASEAVVAAHVARTEGRSPGYEMIHGDAFELEKTFTRGEVSTVVFCSVLHEIFSYVEHGTPPSRFRFEAVEAIVIAAYRTLTKGGRIVIRDGVTPADEPRVLAFKNPAWREGFELFAKTYEPRKIQFEDLGDGRVRLSQPDLFEFLTTFTWGPDSFPYEIREQRAVLPRAEYVKRLLAACDAADPEAKAREVEVPPDLASYLQPGYPANIAPNATIFDGTGTTELSMPDVNGVWVIEKG